jgi:hypothetical protein
MADVRNALIVFNSSFSATAYAGADGMVAPPNDPPRATFF